MADMMQGLGKRCPAHDDVGCADCAENLPGRNFSGADHDYPIGGTDRCGGRVISSSPGRCPESTKGRPALMVMAVNARVKGGETPEEAIDHVRRQAEEENW